MSTCHKKEIESVGGDMEEWFQVRGKTGVSGPGPNFASLHADINLKSKPGIRKHKKCVMT